MKSDFLLSVVIPVYNEEGNIDPLLEKLLPIVSQYNYEVIFVNDGSKDKTVDEIKRHAEKNKKIKLISFLRNFSHQTALTAGYHHSLGDCVVSIDADLQDPPELIHDMIKKWQEGFKVIYAKRSERHESFFKIITAHAFYQLINRLSSTSIPENVGDYRLIDREVVEMLNSMPDQ
jgi:dolichol-phosphate mannosyltransferase